MKIHLLDYTGKGQTDPGDYAARHLVFVKNTRLGLTPEVRAEIASWPVEKIAEELEGVRKTIRSSWEFIEYQFLIEGMSRSFAQQFTRTRTASYAHQSMRVKDDTLFEQSMPATVQEHPHMAGVWNNAIETIRAAYRDFIADGVPPQDARDILPLATQGNIIVKLNLRTFADMMGKRVQSNRAQKHYEIAARWMSELAEGVHPWVKPFLYPERTRTPALDALLKGALPGTPAWEALKEIEQLKGIWG